MPASQAARRVAAAVASSTRTKSSPSGALPKPSCVSSTPELPSFLVSDGFMGAQPPRSHFQLLELGLVAGVFLAEPGDNDGASGKAFPDQRPAKGPGLRLSRPTVAPRSGTSRSPDCAGALWPGT